jgi:hypothetical protein
MGRASVGRGTDGRKHLAASGVMVGDAATRDGTGGGAC